MLGLYSLNCSSNFFIYYRYSSFSFLNCFSYFLFILVILWSTCSDWLLRERKFYISLDNFETLLLNRDFGFNDLIDEGFELSCSSFTYFFNYWSSLEYFYVLNSNFLCRYLLLFSASFCRVWFLICNYSFIFFNNLFYFIKSNSGFDADFLIVFTLLSSLLNFFPFNSTFGLLFR